jgi:hypothetical protein
MSKIQSHFSMLEQHLSVFSYTMRFANIMVSPLKIQKSQILLNKQA